MAKREFVTITEHQEEIKKQWENAADRLSTIASMMPKTKNPGSNVQRALYALEDEFRELGEKISKAVR